MPVKFFSSPRLAFRYIPFYITSFTLFERCVNKHFDKTIGADHVSHVVWGVLWPRASASAGSVNTDLAD
jgi:hypothetical protein